jgi:hypothetical protein
MRPDETDPRRHQETTMTRITRTLTAAGLALSIAIGTVGASATPGTRQQRRRRRDHRRTDRALCHRAGIQNDNRNVTVTRSYGHRPPQGTPRSVSGRSWRPRAASSRGATATVYFRGYVRRCMQNNVRAASIFFRSSACAASRPSVGPG